MSETEKLLAKSKRLMELTGYELDEDEPEPVQTDIERANRALVLYERKQRDLELDKLEKRALELLIRKLEK